MVLTGNFVAIAEGAEAVAAVAAQFTLLKGGDWTDSRFYRTENVLAMVSKESVHLTGKSLEALEAAAASVGGEFDIFETD